MPSIWDDVINYIEPSAYAEQISPNFRREEFNQPKKPLPLDQVMVDPELVRSLEILRSMAGNNPMTINSGYRNPSYNASIGGAIESQHKYGRASDIRIKGMVPSEVNSLARQSGLFGYVEPQNLTPNWTHLDVRTKTPDTRPINNIPMYSYILESNKDKNFVDRLYNPEKYPVINNPDGTFSTMKMASSDNIAFPTIVYNKKNQKLIELSPEEAYNYAMKTGEFIELNSDEEAADFAANGYKKAFPKNYFKKR